MPVSAQPPRENRSSRWPLARLLGLLTIALILIVLAVLQVRQFDQADALRERVDFSFETRAPVVIFSAQDDDPALARRVGAMLTKSKASLGDLVGTVEAVLRTPSRAATGTEA